MSSNSVSVYLNSLPGAYQTLSDEQRKKLEANIKGWLQRDLDEKVHRAISTPNFGPLPIVHQFVLFFPELFQLYIHGLFYSTIALCGVAAERLCVDLVAITPIEVNGKHLSDAQKESISNMRLVDLIDTLFEWKIISSDSKERLQEVRQIRNKYVHPNPPPFEGAKSDAEKVLKLMCEVVSVEFGPSSTGRYTIEDGAMKRRF
jgi:hypothetical protein